MSITCYYKGANGQEYVTPEDALHYGGGLVGKRELHPDTFVPPSPEEMLRATANRPEGLFKAPSAPKPEIPAAVSVLSLEQLRQRAKALKVKGWNLMGAEALAAKLAEAQKEAKGIAGN